MSLLIRKPVIGECFLVVLTKVLIASHPIVGFLDNNHVISASPPVAKGENADSTVTAFG